MRNKVFFPQGALDEWLVEDRVEITHDELTLKSQGRHYKIVEAVRITEEVTGTPDPHEVVGRVKSLAYLGELGAEVLGDSMVLGDNAYEVIPGFAGSPIGTFADHRKSIPEIPQADQDAASDEELLGAFLASAL